MDRKTPELAKKIPGKHRTIILTKDIPTSIWGTFVSRDTLISKVETGPMADTLTYPEDIDLQLVYIFAFHFPNHCPRPAEPSVEIVRSGPRRSLLPFFI